jgi:hypothetical protein
MAPIIRVIRPGDITKANPFTICIVANPVLEAPWRSGQFIVDPITEHQSDFDSSAAYVEQVLFGLLPGQAERFLGDPSIGAKVTMISLFVPGVPAEDANSLVAQDGVSNLLVARRTAFRPFLARYGLAADVVYAISGSETHTRASAWPTTDDDTGPGDTFLLDETTLHHRHRCRIPGTVAQHSTSGSLTALHEFGHALSSYSNGQIVDLYVDGDPGVNNRRARPIPPKFAVYNGTNLAADPVRDKLGYGPGWTSYHCALNDPRFPAVMDDYWQASGGVPERCQHDQITRRFLLDRIRAKQGR